MYSNLKILKEYEKAFYGHTIPKTLQALAQFEEEVEGETYAESFWLKTDKDIFNYWLNDSSKEEIEEYSSHVFPFAHADGTGAFYAFWVKDDTVDLEEAPVVCYGSEGEVKIVSKNLKDLIKILSYGPEGMDGNYGFYEEETIETFTQYYPNFMVFREWMKETLSIEPIKNWKVLESEEVNEIIAEANRQYQKDFDAWQYRFYPSPEEIDAEAKIASEKREAELFKKRELIFKKIKDAPSAALYVELSENTDNYKEKKEYLHEALKLDENNIDALYKLAEDDYAHRLKYYHKIESVIQNPEKSDIYYHLATAYYYEDNYDEALNYYKKYLTINPRPEETSNYGLEETCSALDIDMKGIYEEAIKISPGKENYKELADLYFDEESYENAMQCLRGLFEVGVVEEYNYSIWGNNFSDEGYNDYAIEVFEEGIKKITDPDEKGDIYGSLVEVYEKTEDKDKVKKYQNLSIASYKQALELKENEEYKARILEDIADIYDSQGESQTYIDYMTEALKFADDDERKSEILYNIAETYAEMKEYEKAIEYAKKSYLLDEDEDVEFFITQQEAEIAISEAEETLTELNDYTDKHLELIRPKIKKGFIQTLFVLLLAIIISYIWGATWFFWAIFTYFFISAGSIALIKIMMIRKRRKK